MGRKRVGEMGVEGREKLRLKKKKLKKKKLRFLNERKMILLKLNQIENKLKQTNLNAL